MTNQEILDSLRYFSKSFPEEALKEVQRNKDIFTADLLESLDYVYQNVKELYEDSSEYSLHVYAMYLLAEFREKKAFPYLIAFLQLPEEYIDFVIGDCLTDNYHNLLFSTYDSENLQMLLDTIENTELYEWARVAALNTYKLLYDEHIISEDEYVSYLRSLIYEELPPFDSYTVFTAIAGDVLDARLLQMLPDVRFLYEDYRIETIMYGEYDSYLDFIFSEPDLDKPHYFNDTISELETWGCFERDQEERTKPLEKDFTDFIQNEVKRDRELDEVLAQKHKKIGRNDPCPCGSGKKYKRCCMNSPRSETPIIRLEEKFDLLKEYPKDSPQFNQMFEKEAIEIDMLAYKALHDRSIPMWVRRDYEQERIDKIQYLKGALDLFLNKCEREQINSFSDYDERYMVHYRSDKWVSMLVNSITEDDSDEFMEIQDQALEIFRQFSAPIQNE
jgi:hypothetical protein